MMKRMTALLLTLLLLLSAAACKKQDPVGRDLQYSLPQDPICLDPQIADDDPSFLVLKNTMEGLLTLDSGGNLLPGVAEDWSVSEDGLTYTFMLRSTARWQVSSAVQKAMETPLDNRVTAQDFVFALQRALDPNTRSPYAHLLLDILNGEAVQRGELSPAELGVQAEGDFLLTVTLQRPNPEFLRALAHPVALPCKQQFFDYTKGRYGLEGQYFLSNGSFYLSRWSRGSSLLLKQNELYDGERKALPASVTLLVQTEENSRLSRFNSGDSDALNLSVHLAEGVKSFDKLQSAEVYTNTSYALLFQQKNAALSSSNARLALCYAIDPESLGLPAYLSPAKGVIPDLLPLSPSATQPYREQAGDAPLLTFRPEDAKNHLFQLGETELEQMKNIVLLCPEDNDLKLIATHLLQHWQKNLGLYLQMETLQPEEFRRRVEEGNYQIALSPLLFRETTLLDSMKGLFVSSNPLQLSENPVTPLLSGLNNRSEDASLLSALQQSEAALIQSGLLFPVCVEQRYFLMQKGVTGLTFSPFNQLIDFSQGQKTS